MKIQNKHDKTGTIFCSVFKLRIAFEISYFLETQNTECLVDPNYNLLSQTHVNNYELVEDI